MRQSAVRIWARTAPDHRCTAPDAAEGYRFSKAMRSPGFIGVEDIRQRYLPAGFSQFKIEGRGLGSALVLEFLLYYMTKPEYQLQVREAIYLDNIAGSFLRKLHRADHFLSGAVFCLRDLYRKTFFSRQSVLQ